MEVDSGVSSLPSTYDQAIYKYHYWRGTLEVPNLWAQGED